MGTNTGYKGPPSMLADEKEHRRQIAESVWRLLQGKLNCTTTVTLAASATTTTLTDKRIGASTFFGFCPKTADAAGALSGLYVSAQQNGSATLTHANTTTTDRTFAVLLIG